MDADACDSSDIPRLLLKLDAIAPPPIERWQWPRAAISRPVALSVMAGMVVVAITLADRNTLNLTVQEARLVVQNRIGISNEAIPIGVSVKAPEDRESVTVEGLASGAALSLGRSLGSAGWRVAAADLDKTFVAAPHNFIGIMNATIHLHSGNRALLATKPIRLQWIEMPQAQGAPAAPAFELAARPAELQDPASLINRAEDLLRSGEVAAARLLLTRAALNGDPRAAMKLGMTYDQAFLAQWGIVGPYANSNLAREWYDRAMKIGPAEAFRGCGAPPDVSR
jgi:hypothetical protein